MSRVKNPQEKKRLSYDNDCRNSYGENDKSSRKNIRRNKRLSSKAFRAASSRLVLLEKYKNIEEDLAIEIENSIKTSEKVKRLKGFKKVPDRPLKKHVENQQYWREYRADNKQST
ncbi:hypothetical protein [Photobacterium kasasachensis]|uniref:hypothetical protein n=1 Tax=Photobacterium kasasachensis TaxID=2910240 RepID=UPI003D0BB065